MEEGALTGLKASSAAMKTERICNIARYSQALLSMSTRIPPRYFY